MVCTHTQAASVCGVCQPCVYNSEYTGAREYSTGVCAHEAHTHTTHHSHSFNTSASVVYVCICVVSTHTHGVKTSVCGVCS